MQRIGIVGGTFDPIHLGHLMLGEQAFKEYHLDEIWYMPSRQPPHKNDHCITAPKQRVEMIKLAIESKPYFKISDFELTRLEGNTYTADTLRLLKERYPDILIYFIVGADSIFDIEKWYQPEQVLRQAVFLTANREYSDKKCTLAEQILYLKQKYQADIRILHSKELLISSENIRKKVQQNESIYDFLPEKVGKYILEHQLYLREGN